MSAASFRSVKAHVGPWLSFRFGLGRAGSNLPSHEVHYDHLGLVTTSLTNLLHTDVASIKWVSESDENYVC